LNDDIYFRGTIFDGNSNTGLRVNQGTSVSGINYYYSTSQGQKVTEFKATLSTTVRVVLGADAGQFNYYKDIYLINKTALGISSLTVEQMDTYFQMYQDNISGNDVTYTQNEMSITDLTYIIGFGFIWFVIIWSIRKVVL